MPSRESTIRSLKRKIERYRAAIAREEAVVQRETQYVSPFIAGGAGYSPTMSRRLDAEMERRIDAALRHQEAKQNLNATENLLAGFLAGELHANGQKRKDAPSRQRHNAYAASRGDFIKTFAKVGARFAWREDAANPITVKRVNAKTVTCIDGETWKYDELTPITEAGEMMTPKAFGEAFRAWKNSVSGETA